MTSFVNQGVGVGVEVVMADMDGVGAAQTTTLAPGEAPAAPAAPAELGPLGSLPQSPAPPAISPLTEPIDPGNREASINPINLDNDGTPIPATLAHETAQLYVDAFSSQYPTGLMDLDPTQDAMGGIYAQQGSADGFSKLFQLANASNMNSVQNIGLTPSTVHPSQVSLPHLYPDLNPDGLDQEGTENGNMLGNTAGFPLKSFAKIEFADSIFQMTTYAVIIGRDCAAMRQAKRDDLRKQNYEKKKEDARSRGEPEPSPPRDRSIFSKSYVSNQGGMLGPEPDSDNDPDGYNQNPTPRASKRRKANNGSASEVPRRQTSDAAPTAENVVSGRQYIPHTPGAAAVNLSLLAPDPYHVPFIGIHSPGPNIAKRTKQISRTHLKIQFNHESRVFEAIPLHRNGFFCDDEHKRETVVLKSGARLQIYDVNFKFTITGVPEGCTGAELGYNQDKHEAAPPSRRYSEGGKEMSFDFEGSHDVARRSTSPEEDEQAARAADDSQSELSDVEMEDIEQGDENENGVMETIEKDGDEDTQQQPALQDQTPGQAGTEPGGTPGLPQPPKKRGPGRPPKNGIMSKREERQRKKEAMELAKKNAPPPPPGEPPQKRKVGRPRKHPLPEDGAEREKRKYKPRKSKHGEDGEMSEGEKADRAKRREKHKTPPLVLDINDYTEEDLLKPTSKNYSMLIDEVLTAAPEGLTLKQIYKRIQIAYPFFYFGVESKGWESSVRHNLIGNSAFEKDDETHLWHRLPNVDIETAKKRKVMSPGPATNPVTYAPQQHQASMTPHAAAAYPAANNPSQHHLYQPGPAQQPVYANQGQGQLVAGHAAQQPQQFAARPTQGTPQSLPRPAYPSQTPGQKLPVGVAGTSSASPARPLPATGAQNAYSSPYVSKPASQIAQPGATPHSVARQLSQPSNGASQANSVPPAANPNATPIGHSGTGTPQAVGPNGRAAPAGPPVPAELIKLVDNFKKLVEDQLQSRSKAPLLLAMSAIFRGLGLSSKSIIPEEEKMEDIVRKVFETSRKGQSIHPDLFERIMTLKNTMMVVLDAKLGPTKAECLFLSAVGRALGFTGRSIMPNSQDYDKAENVLMTPLEKALLDHGAWKVAQGQAAVTPVQGPTQAQRVQVAPQGQASQVAMAPVQSPPPQAQRVQVAPQGQASQAAVVPVQGPPTPAQRAPVMPQGQTSQAPMAPVQGPTQAQRAQATPQAQASQAPMVPTQVPVQTQGVSAAPQRQASQLPMPGPMQAQGPPATFQAQASQAPSYGSVQGQRAQGVPQNQASQGSPAPTHASVQASGHGQRPQVPPQSRAPQAFPSPAPIQAPLLVPAQHQQAQAAEQIRAPQASPAPTHAPVQVPAQHQQAHVRSPTQPSKAPVAPMHAPVQASVPAQRAQAMPQGQAPQASMTAMQGPPQVQRPQATPQGQPSQTPSAPMQAQRPPAVPQQQPSQAPTASIPTPPLSQGPHASPQSRVQAVPLPAVGSGQAATPAPAAASAPVTSQPPAVALVHPLPPKPPPPAVLPPSPTTASASTATVASSSPGPSHGLISTPATTPAPLVCSPAAMPAQQATM